MTRRGFTLIELSVLITVLALTAALILPNLPNMKTAREERDFRFALRRLAVQARESAILGKEPVDLRVDEGSDQIVIERQPTEDQDGLELDSLAAPEGIRFLARCRRERGVRVAPAV